MTASTPRPEPNESEPAGYSLDGLARHLRAREPERVPERSIHVKPYRPLVKTLPAVGSGEPPRGLAGAEALCGEFCASWDGSVAPRDIIAVITIASALCRVAAIVIPLFMRRDGGRPWFTKQLHKASRRHFRERSEAFHESFASELSEFVWALPDNGVSREEVEGMLSELTAWNSSTRSPESGPLPSSSPPTSSGT